MHPEAVDMYILKAQVNNGAGNIELVVIKPWELIILLRGVCRDRR